MHAAGMNESSMGGMEGKRYGRSSIEGMPGAGGKQEAVKREQGGSVHGCCHHDFRRKGGRNEWISSGSDWLAMQPSSSLDITVDGQQVVTPHLSIPPTRYKCHESAKNRAEVDRLDVLPLFSFSYDYHGGIAGHTE